MLDFLNDLQMSPNLSFCTENEDQNVAGELSTAPCPAQFPFLEHSQDFKDFFI